ncbi:unnamed protein product [Microthlaspi erraticum]|uniref:Uncharacterized protein n=1 Tax=Microthlaspi erraticum TaxID=1685480 RepID=A0A6D2JNI3_9BRAS|nr:unnamed protein product [Microthlaspi erraticum]
MEMRFPSRQTTHVACDGMSIEELKKNVLGEFFGGGGCGMTFDLSCWSPNTNELATEITTPLVMVTSVASISYFCKHYSVKHTMNLFATFAKRVTCTPSPTLRWMSLPTVIQHINRR